tara:strand:+ start:32 stop:928 length:897 start_codon:yes stop_codon:yes gene_type:complete
MLKIILLISFSFCFDYHLNQDIYLMNNSNDFENNIEFSSSNKLKSALFSGIIPGSGQYFINKQKQKGIAFFALEIIGIASSIYFKNKAEKYKFDYQDYADQHWSFSSWCDFYYDYSDESNPFRDLFSNETSGIYSEINSGHGLEFFYDDDGIRKYMKTNTEFFGLFYEEYNLDQNGVAEQFVDERNLQMLKTHDFYEEIVKYDQFFTGWDDQILIQRSTNDWGQDNATSPNKKFAKSIYDKSVKNYKTKDIIVNFIYANHAISILDALVFSGKSSKTSLTYDYNPRLNFHQALISIKL